MASAQRLHDEAQRALATKPWRNRVLQCSPVFIGGQNHGKAIKWTFVMSALPEWSRITTYLPPMKRWKQDQRP